MHSQNPALVANPHSDLRLLGVGGVFGAVLQVNDLAIAYKKLLFYWYLEVSSRRDSINLDTVSAIRVQINFNSSEI